MSEGIETVIVGAGVVGLAIARQLAMAGQEVLILEAAAQFGTGISSRSSEVIHAGLYYPKDSLKAQCCVAGKNALYAYCRARDVPHRQCGKIIAATDDAQIEKLEALRLKAIHNGVDDLRWLSQADMAAMAPALRCTRALFSPSSGILDSHSLMTRFLEDASKAGAAIAYGTTVTGIEVGTARGYRIETLDAAGVAYAFHARKLINAAGLGAQPLARKIRNFPIAAIPHQYLAKGNYFTLSIARPFNHLIYPLPEPGGLGIHATLDLGGQIRFGPDVEWVEKEDYQVNLTRKPAFVAAIRRYYPGLQEDDLHPAYAGIRPKIVPQGAADADFIIQNGKAHGFPGLIQLFGIESPGITAAMALAERVSLTLDPP